MRYNQILKRLEPKNLGTSDIESFDSYKKRARELLPNWPNCALEQWLYRHYRSAIEDYSWLRFDKMYFQFNTWSNEKIYTQISYHIINSLDSQGQQIYIQTESMRSWLQRYFLNEGTWP